MMIKNWKWHILTAILAILGIGGLYFIGGDLFSESFETVEVSDSRLSLVQGLALKGQPAPEFELPLVYEDKQHWMLLSEATSNVAYRPKVLVFWATWHQASVDQVGILATLSDAYAKATLSVAKPEIIAVNLQESKKAVRDFLAQNYGSPTSIVMLSDKTGQVGELYNVRTLPTTFFVDSEWIIQDIFVGVLNKDMLDDKINKLIVR